ncbi:MAG: leucine-rich repeat domain-containing protein [Clostridia bacterium]|nr:leucine-rich repeat domain-containing protein [Clostridia bacterium]
MKKTENRKTGGSRFAAALLLLLAAGLGVLAYRYAPSAETILLAACAALALLLALAVRFRHCMTVVAYILLIADMVGVGLVAADLINDSYAWSDSRFVPHYALVPSLEVQDSYPEHFTGMASLETLDMRGSTVTDFSPLYEMPQLRHLDLRDNHAFTQAEYDALSAALPDCDILWSVPTGDGYFDSSLQEVDLRDKNLSAGQLTALLERYPDKRFSYTVPLMGRRYEPDVDALDLRNMAIDAEALAESLPLLKQVREIDFRGTPASLETIDALKEAWPDIHFIFTCDTPGGDMTTEDSVITASGDYEDLLARLAYADCLPNLTLIDATAADLTLEEIIAVQGGGYAVPFVYGISAFGRRVTSLETELNLDGTQIDSVDEVEYCLACMPNLKKLSMCGCGLSEDEMGRLFDAHPDVKFVWLLQFGKYTVRTDATAFTTDLWDGNYYNYTSATFACLRYCTDLMMLDLGHNKITSLEAFRGLTKLRVLILADNDITDISALEDMKDLEYVELFLNSITDLSPLADKDKLVDLNIFYNPLGNGCEVLESMTSLKRLWAGRCRLTDEELERLRLALPETQIVTEGRSSTGNGWRDHPHYETLKKMYQTEMYIPFDE